MRRESVEVVKIVGAKATMVGKGDEPFRGKALPLASRLEKNVIGKDANEEVTATESLPGDP